VRDIGIRVMNELVAPFKAIQMDETEFACLKVNNNIINTVLFVPKHKCNNYCHRVVATTQLLVRTVIIKVLYRCIFESQVHMYVRRHSVFHPLSR
jgi:hypothetical protein